MTDSLGKKPQNRRNSFDADLDAMLDEAELSLSPIDDLLDEDAIDRLLIDDGFDREDDAQTSGHHKLEPTMEDAQNSETEPDDLVEDLSFIQAETDADEMDLRLDEASAELELPADQIEMLVDDAPLELIADIEPTFTQEAESNHTADEIDLRLDLADTDSPSLKAEDDLVYEPIDTKESEEPIESDALDLKLQQASEELELPFDQEDDLLEPEAAEHTASSIERLGIALLEDEPEEIGSALSDDLPISEEVDSDEDFISMMLDQEAELATDLDEAYDNQLNDLKTQATEHTETNAIADEQQAVALAQDEPEIILTAPDDNQVLAFENDDDIELVDQADDIAETAAVDADEMDPESAELEEEVLAFGAFADDDWHTAEQSAEPSQDDLDLVSQDEIELDEQDSIIAEQPDEPQAEESELDELDFSALADSVADDSLAEVEQEEIMDEFGDEDAESALARQIEESLLADNDAFADDSFENTENAPNNINELNALEVIDDEFSDIPGLNSEIDEFSDDDLLIGVDLADLDSETASDEQIEGIMSDQTIESGLEDDDFLMADFDISAEQDNENSSENPYGDDSPLLDEPIATDFGSNELDNSDFDDDLVIEPVAPVENNLPINEAAVAALALAEFKSEQESFNKQQKKLIGDLEKKTKKSSIITYTSLGFGLIAMSVAGYLGFVAHSAKNEATRLNEVIVGLEKKLQELPAKPIESPAEAVDELPEDADLESDELKEVEPKAPEPATETKQIPQHGKTALAAPVTENDLEHKSETADKASKESSSEHADKSEPVKTELKKESTHEDAKEAVKTDLKEDKATKTEEVVVPKKKIIFVDEKAATKEVSEKPAEPVAEKKLPEAPKKALPAIKPVKTPVKKKPVKAEAIVKNEPVVIKKLQSGGDWSVNLIAFKQDWYAKGKANEFRQKGIPVDIVPVQIDNVTWYRVRVNGFNGRADANAYAERVKKALNLSSVWVGK